MKIGRGAGLTFLLLLVGFAVMPIPLVYPYIQQAPVHLRATSPYQVKIIYGAMPPSITVIDPKHSVGYMVRLIILDLNTMKLHVIGSVTGSGTNFFPQRIF